MASADYEETYVGENVERNMEQRSYEKINEYENENSVMTGPPSNPAMPPPQLLRNPPQQNIERSHEMKNYGLKWLTAAFVIVSVIFAGMFVAVFVMITTGREQGESHKLNDSIDAVKPVIYSEQNAELNASLARAREERRAIEGREGFCFVKYNGKCFWIETNYNKIPFNKAKEMCAARGGTPADIYSEEPYNMIKDYVRRQILAGDSRMYLWLGVRFNVGNMTASPSDGTPAPFLKWHPTYPQNKAGWEYIGFNVGAPWNAADQDMYNLPDNHNCQGVLCQKY